MYVCHKSKRCFEVDQMKEHYRYSNYWKDIGGSKRLDFIFKMAKKLAPDRILDVGCGTGELTIPLGLINSSVLGIDVHEGSIDLAKTKNIFDNVKFKAIDINEVDQLFDLTISCQVLEHLSDPSKMLKEISRVTKHDGTIIVTVPNGYGPSELMSRLIFFLKRIFNITKNIKSTNQGFLTANTDNPHIQFFTVSKIKSMARKSNLRILKIRNHMFILNTFPFSLAFFYSPEKIARFLEYLDSCLADILPHFMVGGWYFIMKKGK